MHYVIANITVAQPGQSARLLTEWSGVQIPLVIFFLSDNRSDDQSAQLLTDKKLM